MSTRDLALCATLTLALLTEACTPVAAPGWSGYVEGDYVYLSSALGGTLTQLSVRAGDQAAQGAPLFSLDASSELAARLQAQASLERSLAQSANLGKGRRSEELAVVRAQLAQARTLAEQARADLAREEKLVQQGFVSVAKRDTLRAASEQARSRVSELSAQLSVAQLPARSDERSIAQADVQAASQVVKQQAWREAQKAGSAPVSARVTDTFFRVGEWVAPGQPVLSLLPPANLKVRFFVPQSDLATLKIGAPVSIHCDGCASAIPARITFMANRAEYTPPVIYSNAQRSKLVFMLEARPDPADALKLKPGQPVDVTLGAERVS